VQVGGNFTLAPTSAETRPALFVAGGIGITALSSMIGHLAELEAQNQQGAAQEAAKLHVPLLLYSGAKPLCCSSWDRAVRTAVCIHWACLLSLVADSGPAGWLQICSSATLLRRLASAQHRPAHVDKL